MVTKTVTDLPLQPVDSASPVPLYHQIEMDLRRMMSSGVLITDDVLPPEINLALAYGVGRHTMRMALSRLTTAGWIARQAGRGTFIIPRAEPLPFYLDASFTHQMEQMGMNAHSQVIHAMTGVIDEHAPSVLHGKMGAPYFHLARLRFGDELPIVLQYSYIITELCPNIDRYDFRESSLYDVLATEYQLVVERLTHVVSAVSADKQHVEYLRVKRNTPLLLVKSSVYLDTGEIIEYTVSYYRSDRYEYSVTRTGKD